MTKLKSHFCAWLTALVAIAILFGRLLEDYVAGVVLASILLVLVIPTSYLVYWLARLQITRTIVSKSIVTVGVAGLTALGLSLLGIEPSGVTAGAGTTIVVAMTANVLGSSAN